MSDELAKPFGESDEPDSPILDSVDDVNNSDEGKVYCTHGGKTYKKGDIICMGGTKHQCFKSGWVNLNKPC